MIGACHRDRRFSFLQSAANCEAAAARREHANVSATSRSGDIFGLKAAICAMSCVRRSIRVAAWCSSDNVTAQSLSSVDPAFGRVSYIA